MKKLFFIASALLVGFYACKKDDTTPTTPPAGPNLVFKFKFDSTQVRLDSHGQVVSVLPAGHSGQCPKFNLISTHYIELSPNIYTLVGSGKVLYKAAETTAGGTSAIDFSKSVNVAEGQTCLTVPLSSITPGTYPYLRVSLAYQNYDIKYRENLSGTDYNLTGTLASFIGFDTYITSYKIKDSTITVNGNRLQGYWGFETSVNILGTNYKWAGTGQTPPGATTVPNPLFATSPIQQGSCLVTGAFVTPLTITGNETKDIVVTMSVSTNKSFEWKDANMNGVYEPLAGDTVVDMGIRGLIPSYQ